MSISLPNNETTSEDLYYLALFLKRLTHTDIRGKCQNDDQCERVKEALRKLENELVASGINPR